MRWRYFSVGEQYAPAASALVIIVDHVRQSISYYFLTRPACPLLLNCTIFYVRYRTAIAGEMPRKQGILLLVGHVLNLTVARPHLLQFTTFLTNAMLPTHNRTEQLFCAHATVQTIARYQQKAGQQPENENATS